MGGGHQSLNNLVIDERMEMHAGGVAATAIESAQHLSGGGRHWPWGHTGDGRSPPMGGHRWMLLEIRCGSSPQTGRKTVPAIEGGGHVIAGVVTTDLVEVEP